MRIINRYNNVLVMITKKCPSDCYYAFHCVTYILGSSGADIRTKMNIVKQLHIKRKQDDNR